MADLYAGACASALTAARNLFARLQEVFRFIEPEASNLQVYGHELRHLLILSCTEVESGLKAVLKANNVKPKSGKSYVIADYHRLAGPMRLGDWKVELQGFPNSPSIAPFADWKPDTSPSWWSAHNAVKHNREQELPRASLRNVLDALAAVYVVISAQFGAASLHSRGRMPLELALVAADNGFPKWEPAELYVPPGVPGGYATWTPVPLLV